MTRTRHFQRRMSQRGISLAMVELACQFGEQHQDKIYLDRRGLESLIASLLRIERTAMKALDKGGVVVVENDGVLITTYDRDSYDRRKIQGAGNA